MPRMTPRREGPGPSPQNHSPRAASEPVRMISPSGVTHSTASWFLSLMLQVPLMWPMPSCAASGMAEVMPPAPLTLQQKPLFISSAWSCAWITYGSTTAYMFSSLISMMRFIRRRSSLMQPGPPASQ